MLKGRAAIVTGSTSGIGRGIASALASQGCSIMLNGLGSAEAIEKDRAEMALQFGVEVLYNGADLSKSNECIDLVVDAERRLGRIDVLVNNAGIQFISSIEDFPAEQWDAILAINLSSAFHTIRSALPSMRRRGWGRVINIASTHGLVASKGKSAYVAAKHGLVGLTKAVALETAGSGVTCNAICPGWVQTSIVERQIETRMNNQGISMDQARQQLLLEKQPSGAFTTVEQIGAMATFLCTEAAANITGTCMPMDGGWLAQ